jgi:type II secretory ATPase GspE/PulE/Tfp pilus assembly ATPase PilB-like protein
LKPYIIASALDTIIAQRLVRRICPYCKQEKVVTPEERSIIEAMMTDTGMNPIQARNLKLYEGVGCDKCNNS